MIRYFVLSAIGGNRPGVVAEISELIYRCGCNLEDSRMSLLGDHFALQILVTGDKDGIAEELREGCGRLQKEKGLAAFLFPVPTEEHAAPVPHPEPNYELRVVGVDRAGIVYRTTRLLADRSVNIVKLETWVTPAPESGSQVFTMTAELVVPPGVDGKRLRKDLEDLADELHVEVSLSRTLPGR